MRNVFADAQAMQGAVTGERGIGRYVAELARALERRHPGAVSAWVLRPEGPVPPQVPELLWHDRFRLADDPGLGIPDVWHVHSPFESLDSPLETIWPTWARGSGTRLYVTLYDLIPLIYPETYLPSARWRAGYRLRCEVIAYADRVLAISEATARDAVSVLGLDPRKIEVIGTGLAEIHARPGGAADPWSEVPGLRPGFLMYTGGIDFRKNIEGLFAGYALLPPELRRRHQLAVVCRASESEIAHLMGLADRLGIADDVLMTGYVSDSTLSAMYATTHLFVFPSLYEGFGMPVVEAQACGAPTVAGDNSSLIELVPDARGRFDSSDPRSIARCLGDVLADDELRLALRRPQARLEYTWDAVADRVSASYERRQAPRRRRQCVWLVSPMPPEASGVADYSLRLLVELAKRVDVTVISSSDSPVLDLPGVRWFTYGDAEMVERVFGPPDLRIMAVGNSEFHVPVIQLLRRFGGVALAHDVRLTGLMSASRVLAPELVDAEARVALDHQASDRRGVGHEGHHWLTTHDYYRANALQTGAAVEGADLMAVHSIAARALARLAVPPSLRERIVAVGFGHPLRQPSDENLRDAVVTFGVQHWSKHSLTVCTAFTLLAPRYPDLTFALVGKFHDEQAHAMCTDLIAEAGLTQRVRLVGWAPPEEYEDWLGRARLAVQLRTYSNGESSAAIADCLGAGIPTVATETGPTSELGDVCHLVAEDIGAEALARVLADILDDDAERAALGAGGRAHAADHTFGRAAEDLLSLIADRSRASSTDGR